jgi:hypothetical protein
MQRGRHIAYPRENGYNCFTRLGGIFMIITQEEIIEHATNYFMVLKTGGTADNWLLFF